MACMGLLGLAWVVGYGLCRAMLRAHWRDVPTPLRLGLGWVVGAACAGMTTFGAIALTPGSRGLTVGFLMAAGLGAWLVRPKRRPIDWVTRVENWKHRVTHWLAGTGFGVVLILWIIHGLDLGADGPAGGWDAWSIWTHRARYFLLDPAGWTRGFDPVVAWSHPEYPSLLPSLISFGWLPAGRCVAASPIGIALMTQVSTLLLLVGFGQAAYPRTAWPWVFGAFYATIPLEWSQDVAWQYADRPLALFFLAGAGCLALALRQGRRDWLILSGFCWGAAAFTKDEGKAMLVVLGIGSAFALLCALGHGRGRRTLASLALLAVGLGPGLVSLAIQRHFAPLPSNLIARMPLAPLADPDRSEQIGKFLLQCWGDPATGWLWWGCGLVLVSLAAWVRQREIWLLWGIAGCQLAIYLLIFQLTPEDLTWHLSTAMSRLLFHIGPIVFLAATGMILEALELVGRTNDAPEPRPMLDPLEYDGRGGI